MVVGRKHLHFINLHSFIIVIALVELDITIIVKELKNWMTFACCYSIKPFDLNARFADVFYFRVSLK